MENGNIPETAIKLLPRLRNGDETGVINETVKRLHFDSTIFQATCVDSTVIPFVTQIFEFFIR